MNSVLVSFTWHSTSVVFLGKRLVQDLYKASPVLFSGAEYISKIIFLKGRIFLNIEFHMSRIGSGGEMSKAGRTHKTAGKIQHLLQTEKRGMRMREEMVH